VKALPAVALDTMPRMADFARVLAALDSACPELTGGRALALFMGQRERIAGDVVDANPVAAAVVKLIEDRGDWSGTAAELLDVLTPRDDVGKPARLPKRWPASARGMAGHLRRILPALRAVGIDADLERDSSRGRAKRWTIRKVAQSTVRTVRPSENAVFGPGNGDLLRTVEDARPSATVRDRPAQNPHETPVSDGSDCSDGLHPEPSGRVRVRI
jgi:hypothetical protein